ncbi:MAG TPA: TIGR02270 family protein [Candidatus Dormibacteraeota bacterium]|nr:TIGR02270 family protein [Candidatus Dormibacteraeota bacterium]
MLDLSKLDDRLDAHLDGLCLAGEEGWRLAEEQLKTSQPGEICAAALLACKSADHRRLQQVVDACAANPAMAEGLASALGWISVAKENSYGEMLINSRSAAVRSAGIAALALHRQKPDEQLKRLLADREVPTCAWALKTVGELGRVDLIQDATGALAGEDAEVRFCVAWSAALVGGAQNAIAVLQQIAELPGKRQREALGMAMRRLMFTEGKAWHKKLMQRLDLRRIALIGAGYLGDPEVIPWMIENMKSLPLARVAGEAFYMITGVHLAYRDLEGKSPGDFNAGPTDDPKDENVEMDPDDNLPWPEPTGVQNWWEKNRGQFQNGTRYLLGKPITIEWLKTVLRDGYQRQRAAAALELAIRQPGTPLFNVKAPGFRQIELLGKPGPAIR